MAGTHHQGIHPFPFPVGQPTYHQQALSGGQCEDSSNSLGTCLERTTSNSQCVYRTVLHYYMHLKINLEMTTISFKVQFHFFLIL